MLLQALCTLRSSQITWGKNKYTFSLKMTEFRRVVGGLNGYFKELYAFMRQVADSLPASELRSKIKRILTASKSWGFPRMWQKQGKEYTHALKLQSLERLGTFLNLMFASSQRERQKIQTLQWCSIVDSVVALPAPLRTRYVTANDWDNFAATMKTYTYIVQVCGQQQMQGLY